jgi:hypothetical protein
MNRCRIALLALVILASPVPASAGLSDLCTSVPGACQHTGPDAPIFEADVCYSPASGIVTLKGTAPCTHDTRPFRLKYGEVADPSIGTILAYTPLGDGCEAGQCVPFQPHGGGQEYPMCCENGGPCWPGDGCGGVLYWCYDGVCEEDGTITCFNAHEA